MHVFVGRHDASEEEGEEAFLAKVDYRQTDGQTDATPWHKPNEVMTMTMKMIYYS